MSINVIVPKSLWDEAEDAVITSWLVNDGSHVTQGDILAELMVQKIQYELLAPVTGTLTILKDIDEVVSKGDRVATIS